MPALGSTARGCWAECNVAHEPPAQPWRVQVPVWHLCARGSKAGGRGDDSAAKMQASPFQIAGTWRTPHAPGESACICAFVGGWMGGCSCRPVLDCLECCAVLHSSLLENKKLFFACNKAGKNLFCFDENANCAMHPSTNSMPAGG